MKVVTEEQYVPAKSYTVTKYVASDGKEFSTQRDCERYEKQLEIMKHPVIASRIDGLYTFDYEYPATLYYISSEEDYSFLTTCWLCSSRTETDFYKYGPGWYLFYSIDGGDSADSYHFFNYDQYEKKVEEQWMKWKTAIRLKIFDAYQKIRF